MNFHCHYYFGDEIHFEFHFVYDYCRAFDSYDYAFHIHKSPKDSDYNKVVVRSSWRLGRIQFIGSQKFY
jgi:hypothetical protein